MRIVYLHQYFSTRKMVGGTRSYEMARRLIQRGHEVHVITSERETAGGDAGWRVTDEDGIRVHWLPVPYANSMGFVARLRAFAKFALGAMGRAASLRGDVVFATSTPLTIAIPGIYAAWRARAPLVFEVRDLWPDAPIQMGVLRSRFLIAAARWLERLAYRRSASLIALTPGMKAGIIAQGIAPEKITVVPNSSDLDLFSPDIDGSEFRAKLGLGRRFALVYFGTMGPANGLDFVLDAAAVLKRRKVDDIVFVLHGDGRERPRLEACVAAEGLDNIVFSKPIPEKAAVAKLAAAADVCMTIYKNLPVLHTCSPNKMFDGMAAGKPLLTNMPGWLQGLVEGEGAGVFVRPDEPEDFADKAIWLRDHPERLREMARNSHRLAREMFARDLLADRLCGVIERAGTARKS